MRPKMRNALACAPLPFQTGPKTHTSGGPLFWKPLPYLQVLQRCAMRLRCAPLERKRIARLGRARPDVNFGSVPRWPKFGPTGKLRTFLVLPRPSENTALVVRGPSGHRWPVIFARVGRRKFLFDKGLRACPDSQGHGAVVPPNACNNFGPYAAFKIVAVITTDGT